MKKLTLLVLSLIIAACGAGSGTPDNRFVARSSSPYAYVTENAVKSNNEITSIASEVRKCADDNCIKNNHNGNGSNLPTVTPRISTYNDNTGTWNVYNLSDIKFNMVDEGLEPGDESFSFVIDTQKDSETYGKIIGINMIDTDKNNLRDSETHPKHGDKNIVADFVRNSDNSFSGYVKHNGENADENGWTYVEKAEFQSLGKGLTNKLTYSDFGKLDLSEAKENWTPVFIGGYEIKKIEAKDIVKTTSDDTFSGKITGYVAVRNNNDEVNIIQIDSNATLTFDATNSARTTTLNAGFSNWYDLKYTETLVNENTSNNIELSNYKDGANVSYKMMKEETDNKVSFDNVVSDVRYFGDNKKPTEAVGLIQIRDCGTTACPENFDTPEVRVDLGFGVKR